MLVEQPAIIAVAAALPHGCPLAAGGDDAPPAGRRRQGRGLVERVPAAFVVDQVGLRGCVGHIIHSSVDTEWVTFVFLDKQVSGSAKLCFTAREIAFYFIVLSIYSHQVCSCSLHFNVGYSYGG